MPSFLPSYKESTQGVLIGTVGGGNMSAGSHSLTSVGFTPLPGRSSADYFSAADVGRIVMILGAAAGGATLVTKVATFIDTQNVTLVDAAVTAVINSISNTVIFRPIKLAEGSLTYEDTLTGHNQGKFTQLMLDGEYPVVAGQPFLFTSTDPNLGIGTYNTFFGGEVDTVDIINYPGTAGGDDNKAECSCVSYEVVMTRRVIQGKQYNSQTMKQIAASILSGMTAEFFGLISPDGITHSIFTIEDLTYADKALNDLMAASTNGTDNYYWKCDQWRNAVIAIQAATPAPFSIDESTGTDRNVLIDSHNSITREKFGNQVYSKADKGLGDLITESVTNSFLGTAIPSRRISLTMKNKSGVTPTLTINGVAKNVFTCPVDVRSDSTAITIPAGFDWGWPIDSDYLFVPNGVPTSPAGVPPGGTAVIKYRVANPTSSLYTHTASIDERSSVQGGSGIHDVIINVPNPVTRSELDTQTEATAKSLGVISKSFNVVSYRSGLRAGQGISVNKPSLSAVGTFLVESVDLESKSGWPVWTAKVTIGALVGDYKTAFVDALGLGSVGGGGVSGQGQAVSLTLALNLPSGWVDIAYVGQFVAAGGVAPYVFSTHDGSLPTGLSLDTATGAVTGTPTVDGDFSFNARVTDAALVVQDIAVVLTISLVSSTPTPYPDAPNATGASLSPVYGFYGTTKLFGASGSITLPTDFSHIKQLHVKIELPSGAEEYICPAIQPDATTMAFVGIPQFVLDIVADHTYTVNVYSENEDGKLTVPPFSTSITINHPSITTLTAVDHTPRWQSKDGALHAVVPVSIACSLYPEYFSIWTVSPQYGRYFHGVYDILAPLTLNLGEENSSTSMYPPTAADETVTVYVALGFYTKDIDPTTITGISSTTVVVHAPSAPSASATSGAYILSATPTYAKVGAGGASLFGFEGRVIAPIHDPEFLSITMCIQTLSLVGTPGGQRPNAPDPLDARTRVGDYSNVGHDTLWNLLDKTTGLLEFVVAPEWDVPTDGFPVFDVTLFVSSRLAGTTGATWTKQASWSSAAGVSTHGTANHQSITVDPTKAHIQTGHGVIATDDGGVAAASDSILSDLDNPGFEFDDKGWVIDGVNSMVVSGVSQTGSKSLRMDTRLGPLLVVSTPKTVRPLDPVFIDAAVTEIAMASSDPPFYVWLAFYDSAGGFISDGGSFGAHASPTISPWTHVTTVGVAPSNASTVKAVLEYRGAAAGSGFYYVDNVVLKAQGKSAGPMYYDIADNIALRIGPDYVIKMIGGLPTLSQNIIDLALAVNYDTTNFKKVGSFLLINAVAVDSLIAGNALFAGDVTLARSGGGKVTLNSAGIAFADTNSGSPNATMAIAFSGVTVARGNNQVQVLSTGIYLVIGGLFAGQWDASGVLLQKGSSSVAITSTAVTITNGNFSVNGSGFSVNIDATDGFKMITGSTTVSIAGGLAGAIYIRNGSTFGSLVSIVNPGSVQVGAIGSTQAAYMIPGAMRVTAAGGGSPAYTEVGPNGCTFVAGIVPVTAAKLVSDGSGGIHTVIIIGGLITLWS